MSNTRSERLEKLLNATVLNYTAEINVDNPIGEYDAMYDHLLKGDLDDFFLAPKLEGNPKRKEIFDLVRKYGHLCFYDGNYYDYWLDSIGGFTDEVVVSRRILDNYNFLLELALEKGEQALKELETLQKTDIGEDDAVVEFVRGVFQNDQALMDCLQETSKEDGPYKHLYPEKKEFLYRFPQGVLYLEDENGIKLNTEERLLNDFRKYEVELLLSTGNKLRDIETIEEMAEYLGASVFGVFVEAVHNAYEETKKHGTFSEEKTFNR